MEVENLRKEKIIEILTECLEVVETECVLKGHTFDYVVENIISRDKYYYRHVFSMALGIGPSKYILRRKLTVVYKEVIKEKEKYNQIKPWETVGRIKKFKTKMQREFGECINSNMLQDPIEIEYLKEIVDDNLVESINLKYMKKLEKGRRKIQIEGNTVKLMDIEGKLLYDIDNVYFTNNHMNVVLRGEKCSGERYIDVCCSILLGKPVYYFIGEETSANNALYMLKSALEGKELKAFIRMEMESRSKEGFALSNINSEVHYNKQRDGYQIDINKDILYLNENGLFLNVG